MSFSDGLSVVIQICYRAVVENGQSAPAKCGFAGVPTFLWYCADMTAGANSLHFRHAATGQHTAHAAHHFGHSAFCGEFLHHLLHLLVLLDQATDVLHLGAGTHGDPTFARTTDQLRVAALGRGHGIDDGFHLLELLLCRALGIAHLRQVHATHVRQLVHQAAKAAHVLHLLQLVTEVFEVEALALLQLLGQLIGLVLVEGRFSLLDQAEHVAHAEDTRGDPLRVERFERFALLAHTNELDRLAGDGADRQCGTAARRRRPCGRAHRAAAPRG